MRRALGLGLVFLASCEGLFGVDFDVTARPADAGVTGSDGDAAADASCPAQQHPCHGTCAPVEPSTGCGGAACVACPTAEHGTATCEGDGCAIACEPGFRRCAEGCCALPEAPVAAGTTHTCATSSSGALYCWGYNAGGQLGDQSRDSKLVPSLVFGLEGGVRSVAAGDDATCATSLAGAITGWGPNAFGAVGDGTHTTRLTPASVALPASDPRYVVAGGSHACAVTATGRASCWGYNPSGVIGSGSSAVDVPTPERVEQPEPFGSLSIGVAHACAIGVSGALYCWGSNAHGQLGLPGKDAVSLPAAVPDAAEVISVACGRAHTCVVHRGGLVRCWGDNSSGQLGVGDDQPRDDAVDVLAPSEGIGSVVAGDTFGCARHLSSGALKCWGLVQSGVGVGSGDPAAQLRPVAVSVGGPTASVSAGAQHACARLLDGTLRCWGGNRAGQLGDGTHTDRLTAVTVALP